MTIRSALLGLVQGIRSYGISPHEVRREALALGGRHLGEVMAGARKEIAEPGIAFRRAVLLRAVIRSGARAPAGR
jgi:hypothetical protein